MTFIERIKDIFLLDLEGQSTLPKEYSHEHFPALDGLRGIAVLLVLAAHISVYSPLASPGFRVVNNGWVGVDLFFVLSGFLIGKQLLAELARSGAINLKRFWLKRFFRIVPAYFFTLIIAVIYSLILEQQDYFKQYSLYYLLYLQNYLIPVEEFARYLKTFGLTHTWSLVVEQNFYLLVPIFFLFLFSKAKHNWKWLVIATLSVLLLPLIYRISFTYAFRGKIDQPLFFKFIYIPFYSRYDSLAFGVILAYFYLFYKPLIPWDWPWAKLGLIFVFIPVLFGEHAPSSFFNTSLVFSMLGLGFALIILRCLQPGYNNQKLVNLPILRFYGRISYSFYLLHVFPLMFTIRLTQSFIDPGQYGLAYFIVCFFISLAVVSIAANFMYLLIERPFLKLRGKLLEVWFERKLEKASLFRI
ncbi:MAG: acyltransferase [Anaerolineae bacterium]|nr:acyltransferase [Anaerolineae bacterium]